MDTHDDIVNSQPAGAAAGADAQRRSGGWGSEPGNTDPHNYIPLKEQVLCTGLDDLFPSVRDKHVPFSSSGLRPVPESEGYFLWLKIGDRVRLKRVTTARGPMVGSCGTVVDYSRREGLRLIVVDWDEAAWSPGSQALHDEFFPRRRMYPFGPGVPPSDYFELPGAAGEKC